MRSPVRRIYADICRQIDRDRERDRDIERQRQREREMRSPFRYIYMQKYVDRQR